MASYLFIWETRNYSCAFILFAWLFACRVTHFQFFDIWDVVIKKGEPPAPHDIQFIEVAWKWSSYEQGTIEDCANKPERWFYDGNNRSRFHINQMCVWMVALFQRSNPIACEYIVHTYSMWCGEWLIVFLSIRKIFGFKSMCCCCMFCVRLIPSVGHPSEMWALRSHEFDYLASNFGFCQTKTFVHIFFIVVRATFAHGLFSVLNVKSFEATSNAALAKTWVFCPRLFDSMKWTANVIVCARFFFCE